MYLIHEQFSWKATLTEIEKLEQNGVGNTYYRFFAYFDIGRSSFTRIVGLKIARVSAPLVGLIDKLKCSQSGRELALATLTSSLYLTWGLALIYLGLNLWYYRK